jgi:hypothetical protein
MKPHSAMIGVHSSRSELGVMAQYWVIGGEYADANFADYLPGRSAERYGPFPSYDDARKEWQSRTMATIDNALVRYQVIDTEKAAAR